MSAVNVIDREVKRKRKTCSVCNGNKIIVSEKRRSVFNKPGLIMPDRRFSFLRKLNSRWPEGSVIPGPDISPDTSHEDLQPKKGEVAILPFI